MRARPPDATGTAVARHGDNYELGVVDREVDGSLPSSVHDNSPREQAVEKLGYRRVPRPCVQPEPGGTLSRRLSSGGSGGRLSWRGRRAGRSERDDCAGRSLACQVGEPLAGCLLALHQYGGKRLPSRGLEGCLVTLIDVDELHECPEHAVDRCQPARTRPGPSLIKCLGQGFGPGRPLMTFGVCRPALIFGRRQCALC